jgi:serine/threonine protein kinase/tetratricopeptide (TPR) repeat protein
MKVRALFDLAADHPREEWQAIVAREAAGDEPLQREVLRLLATLGADELDLDNARFDLGPPEEGAERVGTTVAQYRLVRLVGHGGMGTVYEGVRADGAYEQRVAVKFIRPVFAAGAMAARFRRERQILAALEHRNIARLIDGGASGRGEPFFVMEYVDGVPITAYANARHLSIDDRLRLFLQACAAVEHAHGKFIVHRDIKPANILVTADGSVKLLDFGVAKLLGAQDGEELTTMAHQRPFTPEYASPEQLRDEPASAASDLYSLGIVLYELLSGRRPYEVPSRSPIAVLRAVEAEPPRPSAVATAEAAQHSGDMTLPRLRHLLAGELDNVVGKAIRADVDTRYRSVERLSTDVHRYLDGMPVSAQPDSAAYRLRKFVRRNSAGVAAAVTVALGVAIGVAVLVLQARRAAIQHNWEAAVNAAGNLNELGVMHLARGDVAGSDTLLRQAVALCRTPHGAADVPVTCAESWYDYAVTLLWKGEPVEAEQIFHRLLAMAQAAPAAIRATVPMEVATAKVLSGLARARDAQGDLSGAEGLFRQSADLFRLGDAERSADGIEMLGWYAATLERQSRYPEAETVVRQQVALAGSSDASILWLHLGAIHRAEGQLDLARVETQRGRRTRGAETSASGVYYIIITEMEGLFDLADGKVDQAVTELRATLDAAQRYYPPADPRLAEVQAALGNALIAAHRPAEAVPLLTTSYATLVKSFGTDHPETVAVGRILATAEHAR